MPLPLVPLLAIPLATKIAALLGASGAAAGFAAAAASTTTIATTATIAGVAGLAIGGGTAAAIILNLPDTPKNPTEDEFITNRHQKKEETVSQRTEAVNNAIETQSTIQNTMDDLHGIGELYLETTKSIEETAKNIDQLITEKLPSQINERLSQFKDFLEKIQQHKNEVLTIQEKLALLPSLLAAQTKINEELTCLIKEIGEQNIDLKETNTQLEKVNALQEKLNNRLELINAEQKQEISTLNDKIKYNGKGQIGFFKPVSMDNQSTLNQTLDSSKPHLSI